MIVEWEGKIYEIEKEMKVKDLLDYFSLNRESFLAVVDGNLVTEDRRIKKHERVKIVKVMSGG